MIVGSDLYSRDKKRINHLDELVELLMLDAQQSVTQLLKSEIETLRIVILILKEIQNLFQQIDINILTDSLAHELQDAMIGEAA